MLLEKYSESQKKWRESTLLHLRSWEGLMKYMSVVQNLSFLAKLSSSFAYNTEWHHPKLRFSGKQSWLYDLYTASNKRTILMPRTLRAVWYTKRQTPLRGGQFWRRDFTYDVLVSRWKGRKFRKVISSNSSLILWGYLYLFPGISVCRCFNYFFNIY